MYEGSRFADLAMDSFMLLTPDTSISSTNNTITFDSQIDHLAKINVCWTDMNNFSPTMVYSYFSEGWDAYVTGISREQLAAGDNFYVTPGFYKPQFSIRNNYVEMREEGDARQFTTGENTVFYGGENITAKVELNKYTYLPGEIMTITPTLKDEYGNRFLSILNSTNNWQQMTVEILDSSNQVVYSRSNTPYNSASVELPQNMLEGIYKLRICSQYPKPIEAETCFTLSRNIGSSGVKLTVGTPGNLYANTLTVQMLNLNTGEKINYRASNLINGEVFIPASEGEYQVYINTPTQDGPKAIYLRDVSVPGEYVFKSSTLNKVNLAVTDELGNVFGN